MSLSLTVGCAVTLQDGSLLLTRRDDLGAWGLPEGRLRGDTSLDEAAARIVHDASGATVQARRAVGLYFWPGLATVTLLMAGRAETNLSLRGYNALFQPESLPEMPSHQALMALDALAGTRHRPRVFDLSPSEQQRLRLGQNLRRMRRRLRGRGDPPALDVQVVGVVMDEAHRRVLTLQRKRTVALPRFTPQGQHPPWVELSALVEAEARVPVAFRWAGAWVDGPGRRLDLIFAATALESFDLPGRAEWSLARQVALPAREAAYVARVKPSFSRDPVWLLTHEPGVQAGDTIPGG